MAFSPSDNVNAAPLQPNANDKSVTHHVDHDTSYELENKPEIPMILRDLTLEERVVLEKRLVRKIDIRLLPMLVLMYIMNVSCTEYVVA
jgi:hypothetical protein